MLHAFRNLFLGRAPDWYKLTIIAFLAINPVVLFLGGAQGATLTAWLILLEFIFTLAMALKCYPLQPGGLLALQAVLLGLTHPDSVYQHTLTAFPIILLLIFMIAGIFFLKEMLVFCFTKLLLNVRSNLRLALLFCMVSAVFAAFLDALTVLAVIITVAAGFYEVYHKVASGKAQQDPHDSSADENVEELHRSDLDAFRAVLRGLLMHAAAGTVIGGVMTPVGQPQNVLVAEQAGWTFPEFFFHVAPVALPVFAAGVFTCLIVERLQWFGYGTRIPEAVRNVLEAYDRQQQARRTPRDIAILVVQAITALILVFALALHLAAVGLIGLLVIVLATAFTGVTEEQRLGKAFEAALPFTALIVVFFVIVAQIHDQHLFEPVVSWALHQSSDEVRAAIFYLASGLLSAVSDNVFVATIYITEVKAALLEGAISAPEFGRLAVAINTGTNIPSIATPNGQAALLFLLTSAVAPLIRLSYGKMVWMALPYTIALTLTGLWAVLYLL